MGTNSTIGLQMNMRQILNVLSSSLYKGDVLSVATRELLQNSFDAVKKTTNPEIKVSFDGWKRRLRFEDNGVGMTPETVRDVFFTVGGTLKEGLSAMERSGGFGIAKAQFLLAAENIEIVSVRNGVETHVVATQEELLEGRGNFRVLPTSEHSGTVVLLTFPEKYVDETGKEHDVYYSAYNAQSTLKKPLIGYNIPVYWNDSIVTKDPLSKHKVRKSFDWGDVDLYYDTENSGGYIKYHVYCAGLYQFTKNEKYLGDKSGIEITLNIHPKFTAGQREYPFANSRDDFSGYTKDSIKEINDLVSKLAAFLRSEKITREYSSFDKLSYVEVDGKLHERELVGTQDECLDLDDLFENVDNFEELFMLLIEAMAKQAERAKALEAQKENGKEESLKFINKSGLQFTHTDQEKFSKIASVIYDVIYEPTIREKFHLSVSTCGVIIENGKGGCCLTLGGVTGIYVNPLGEHKNANHFAHKMMSILIHELGHTGEYCEGHSDYFFRHEGLIRDIFWMNNLYEKYHAKFIEIYLQYNDTTANLSSHEEEEELPF